MRNIQYLLFLLVFSGFNLKAQTYEVGITGGGAGYIGDLNQTSTLKLSGISAGAFVKMNLDPYWGLGIHYNYGRITADDANSANEYFRDRNLNFHTPINEASLQLEFNFLDYFAGGGLKKFTPYVYAGLGMILFNPKATYNGDEFELRFYATEGQTKAYKNYALTIPYGAGMKFKMNENWGISTQIGYRTSNTDYLDDVSNRYPDPNSWSGRERETTSRLLSNPSNAFSLNDVAATQRGDFRKRDTYMFVGIGISYTFVSQKCYTF